MQVIGKEPLDTLQQWVTEKFSPVPNKRLPRLCFGADALGQAVGCFGKIFRIRPVRDLRTLSLLWPLPVQMPLYRACPSTIVSHLMGHEGKVRRIYIGGGCLRKTK